ncbi:MAG TPA: MFS transporter [Usitatibacter sp.]|jgi:predicted MFS family arabinose efflux permease
MNLAIVLLALASFASAASLRVTDAMLPRLASEFHVGLDHASSVVTGFAVAYGLMQILFGPLGDRFGKLRVIGWASGAASIATAWCLFAPGLEGLLVGRILAGAFCAGIIPLALAWIGDVVPYQDRQPVIARFLLGQISGLALGAAVGGVAAEHAEFRWPFGVLAAWLAICAAMIILAARHDPAPPPAPGTSFLRSIVEILGIPWARVIVGTVFIEGMLVLGATAFIPSHLHLKRGTELSIAGLALVPYAIGGAIFAIFAARFLRALGEVQLARFGAILLMIGFILVAWSPHIAVAAFGCLISGLGFYALHNTLQTNATQMAPTRRGVGVALFASFFFIGQSVGVAIAGLLVERIGTTAVLAAAGVLLIPVGFVFAHLRAVRAA